MFQLASKTLKQHWLTASLAGLAIALFVVEMTVPTTTAGLEFHNDQSLIGQIHQLFSCHFLHWSWEHLFWDLGMFVVLCGFAERISRTSLSFVLATSAVLIPPTVCLFHPELATYRGLSGLDTALFGLVVSHYLLDRISESDKQGIMLYAGLLLAMIAKTVHEFTTGTIFVSDNSFAPVPIAHVVGALIGIATAVSMNYFSKQSLPNRTSVSAT